MLQNDYLIILRFANNESVSSSIGSIVVFFVPLFDVWFLFVANNLKTQLEKFVFFIWRVSEDFATLNTDSHTDDIVYAIANWWDY